MTTPVLRADRHQIKASQTATITCEPKPDDQASWQVTVGDETTLIGQADETYRIEGNQLFFQPTVPGTYAFAVKGDRTGDSSVLEIVVNSVGESPPAEPLSPNFHPLFALVSASVILVLLVVFLWKSKLFTLKATLGNDAAKADPRAVLAAQIIGPTLALAAIAVLAGVWMVMTEWRGRFDDKRPRAAGDVGKAAFSFPDIIAGLGKLTGSTLVLVSGVVLALSVAWMVSSTTAAPESGSGGGSPSPAVSTPSTAGPTPAPTTGGR